MRYFPERMPKEAGPGAQPGEEGRRGSDFKQEST